VSYAKEQTVTLWLWLFAMAVETVVVDLLLVANDVPSAVRVPVLVADLYGLMFAVALTVAVGSRTNVTIELTEPLTVVRPLGRRAEVTRIRFFADEPGLARSPVAPY
jgi:hypothetical protein